MAGGNGDGFLSSADAIWEDLWLWNDRNHNGISEREELSRLARSGVEALDLDFAESRHRDRHGNELRYRSRVLFDHSAAPGGPKRNRTGHAVDVILGTRQVAR